MEDLLKDFLVLPLAATTLCVTISRGKIFRKQRIWISVKAPWIGSLISCPYCLAHWVVPLLVVCYSAFNLLNVLAEIAETAIFIGTITRLIGFSSDEPKLLDKLKNELLRLNLLLQKRTK